MDVTLDRQEAEAAMAVLRTAGAGQGQQSLLLEAEPDGEGGSLTLTAAGAGLWLRLRPGARAAEGGAALADQGGLAAVFSSAPPGCSLRLTGGGPEPLVVRSDPPGGWWSLPTADAATMPLPLLEGEGEGGPAPSCSLPAAALRRLLSRTLPAAAREDASKFTMACVLLRRKGDCLLAAGTDGRRLSEALEPCRWHDSSAPPDCLLPVKGAQAWLKLLDREAKSAGDGLEARVVFSGACASLTAGGGEAVCRLAEGRFAPYESILAAAEVAGTAALTAEGLGRLLAQAGAVCGTADDLRVALTLTAGQIEASARTAAGASRAAAPCVYDGPPLSAAIDPSLLRGLLREAGGEVTLSLQGGERPVLLGLGEGWRGLIMVMS